jgi:2-keto-4-pentenoate hydratase/2-oxohepta-3-ene-1,7-dioic acid hydratase in catechol pathway
LLSTEANGRCRFSQATFAGMQRQWARRAKPPLWMKPGDVVEVEIDGGVGVLCNPIIAEA